MRDIIATICIALTLPVSVFAYTSPGKPVGFVNDFAHVISEQQAKNIAETLMSLRSSTGVEVAVATIPSLGGDTIESYAVSLFEEWGIGRKDTDNGLLILIAPNEKEARIEVGYGLEGTIPDIQAGKIVRTIMIPAFKTGDYGGGIMAAVDAISGLIAGDPTVMSAISSNSNDQSMSKDAIFAYMFFVVLCLNILARVLGKTKSWWLGGAIGATIGTVIGFIWGFIYVGAASVVILTLFGLLFDYIVSKHPPRSGGGFWPMFFGGHGSGGIGGGGFGGFGGGGSGGGGASGRW